jgi:hypothetical protein
MGAGRQYSLNYLLGEIALVALALGCWRVLLIPGRLPIEYQALCFLIALVSLCGAVGGLFLGMAVGLVVGSVLAVASVPFLLMVILNRAH